MAAVVESLPAGGGPARVPGTARGDEGSETGRELAHHRAASAATIAPALPAGPAASALVQSVRFVWRPGEFVEECARRYGDCFTVRLPGMPPQVFFSHPEAIRQIFTGDVEELRAGEANAGLGALLGWNSLLLLDGARHLRERRLMLPPFHGERMQAYGRTMREITDAALDALPLGTPVPLHACFQHITLEVILRTVFGLDDPGLLVRLRPLVARFLALADSPLAAMHMVRFLRVDLGPWSPWGQFVRALRALDEVLYAEMHRRRAAGPARRDDIFSMLLEARDEQGAPMSDLELRDEMFTLLMAGHETTATSLAWAVWRVLSHPDVHAQVRGELRCVVGHGPVEPAHIGRLEYLDAVIKETARLDPVVWNVGRKLTRPLHIGGHHLPAGAVASPCAYLAHRRPDLWPEPERFDPGRFVGVRPNPYAFLPFGGGTRRCIGAAFATYEMKTVLAQLFTRATLRLAPGYQARRVRRTVTVAPAGGVPVVVETRGA